VSASPSSSGLGAGQRLGKYLVTERLGEGGMGVVYAGVHEALGREVAIKLLRADLARNVQMMSRFQAEAEAVSRIGHANIVAVYDFGRLDDGSLYYVMERIRGQTLAARLLGPGQPALEREEAVAIFGQICRALQATHQKKIVHRDLKPDNVFLQAATRPGHPPLVKVLDFGIAKMRGDDQRNLTAVGMLMGTPAFMAPEQATACHLVDGRADLYSLGAMLYQALTGSPPFLGEPMAILTQHISQPPEAPSRRAIQPVPPALDAMVLRALAKDPAERQPDAAQFLAELEAAWPSTRPAPAPRLAAPAVAPEPLVAVAAPPRPAPTTPSPPPLARGRSRAAFLAAIGLAAAVAVIAVVGGVLFLRHPASAPPPAAEDAPGRVLAVALGGDVGSRRTAFEQIGECADGADRAAVARGLDDANPEVRRAAAVAAAAGAVGDRELLGALLAASQRSGGAVALELAVTRFLLGDSSAQAELDGALSAHLGDGPARLRAALALAQKGHLPAARLHAAIAAAGTARRGLRWQAYAQLFQLGDDTSFAGELEKAMAGHDAAARIDAAQTLARSGDGEGKKALAEIAEHGAPGDRADAASVLAELGTPAGFAQLVASLGAADPAVRARAACALGRWGSRAPTGSGFGAKLQPLLDGDDESVRLAAAAALHALGRSR
jgi:HEAT repeat protein/tRNA A-37 threonylcarbamoyl transferase component Bud32